MLPGSAAKSFSCNALGAWPLGALGAWLGKACRSAAAEARGPSAAVATLPPRGRGRLATSRCTASLACGSFSIMTSKTANREGTGSFRSHRRCGSKTVPPGGAGVESLPVIARSRRPPSMRTVSGHTVKLPGGRGHHGRQTRALLAYILPQTAELALLRAVRSWDSLPSADSSVRTTATVASDGMTTGGQCSDTGQVGWTELCVRLPSRLPLVPAAVTSSSTPLSAWHSSSPPEAVSNSSAATSRPPAASPDTGAPTGGVRAAGPPSWSAPFGAGGSAGPLDAPCPAVPRGAGGTACADAPPDSPRGSPGPDNGVAAANGSRTPLAADASSGRGSPGVPSPSARRPPGSKADEPLVAPRARPLSNEPALGPDGCLSDGDGCSWEVDGRSFEADAPPEASRVSPAVLPDARGARVIDSPAADRCVPPSPGRPLVKDPCRVPLLRCGPDCRIPRTALLSATIL